MIQLETVQGLSVGELTQYMNKLIFDAINSYNNSLLYDHLNQ